MQFHLDRPITSNTGNWLLILVVGLLAFSMAIAIFLAYRGRVETDNLQAPAKPEQVLSDETRRLDSCVDRTLHIVTVGRPSVYCFNAVWRLCDAELFNVDQLSDFRLRKEKFTRQDLDERVILVLVVTITASGVLLAGLQLLGSFKLATRDRAKFAEESSLSLERDKISLKSSVTGLLILMISFLFFFVYVKWVYMMTTIGTSPDPDLSAGLPADFDDSSSKPPTTTTIDYGSPSALPSAPSKKSSLLPNTLGGFGSFSDPQYANGLKYGGYDLIPHAIGGLGNPSNLVGGKASPKTKALRDRTSIKKVHTRKK